MAARDEIEVAGVRLTSADKVLYPEQGITKRDLANYMVAVAGWMLPHVAKRPITLVRCPTGRQKKCFYQRHAGSGVPSELGEVPVPGFEEPYLFVRDVRGLVALVQMGVLEIHPWGARNDNPERPDRMIFDLDPGEGLTFADVAAAAREVRAMLESIKLTSFLKTTGGKGLHLVVPIVRRYDWQEVKAFAKRAAENLAKEKPERYLIRMSKAERRGRILIDYLRNDPTSTAIAPYSTRSREGAPVATPLAWEELKDKLDPRAFNEKTVPGRLKALHADPWEDIGAVKQALPRKI
ncbi:MAG: bifunctional non-ous end joining protein LigD [Methylobacteriaceae bacterium]|nr:bifunctional non-ous end joining protein LigD [Methylobacteriaceae bacterium]